MLMAKHALLEKRKKELEELQAKYRLMQEQQKRSNQKLAACETPSEATEIAKVSIGINLCILLKDLVDEWNFF